MSARTQSLKEAVSPPRFVGKRGIAPFILLAFVSLIKPGFADDAEHLPKGYLGIYAQSNSNVLEARNAFAGITVTRVIENSPAEAAGLKEGDIVLQANGKDISDPNQLTGLAETLPIGSIVHLRVERDKEIIEMDLATVARTPPPPDPKAKAKADPEIFMENRLLGFEFRSPCGETARGLGLEPGAGIQVLRLAKKSPLTEAEIKTGDVIAEVGGEPILSPQGFLKFMEDHKGEKAVKLRVTGPDGKFKNRKVRTHQPEKKVKQMKFPPFFNYSKEPTKTTFSIPLLLFKRERLEGATKYQFFWLIRFETGASDELLEVEPM